MICNRCGAQLAGPTPFCPRCGVQLGVAAPPPVAPPYAQPQLYPPFLSRRQFYTSSPQTQALYEKYMRWYVLGLGFFLPGVIGSWFFWPVGVLLIPAVVFFGMSLSPGTRLNKMYKDYRRWYQAQYPPPCSPSAPPNM
ncbi:MAG: hypothetical protein FWF49_02990 [Oscillospiraceae bacterium]|nr:hypothetical protein [Oscillospiraceae bacterium]